MEVSACAQVSNHHIASLLINLNKQRQRAEFCDCVVRQSQSSGQLYPAHRCVLAASSPVLASIVSSTGALVELQALCLNGSVLALLLDFIYTGTLPHTHIRQHYHSLLTTASHLQMNELQEALRAWQRTETGEADETRQPGRDNVGVLTTDSWRRLQPSECSLDSFPRREDIGENFERDSERSEESPISVLSGASCSGSTCNVSSCSSISEDCSDSVSIGSYRPLTYLTPQDLIQNISFSMEAHDVSKVDKEVPRDQFPSAVTANPQAWQKNTELAMKVEDRRNSPHPSCEAVPVICHSSRATTLQLAEASPYLLRSKAADDSNMAALLQPASRDIDHIAEGFTTKYKNHHVEQEQDDRNDKYQTGRLRWDPQNSLDRSAVQDLHCSSSRDESNVLEHHSSSKTGDVMNLRDEHKDTRSSHSTDHGHHHANRESFQNKSHSREDSMSQRKIYEKPIMGLKHKAEPCFDDLPSKLHQMDCSDDGHSTLGGLRAAAPLPVQMSDTGCEVYSYCSRTTAPMDRPDLHCDIYEPQKVCYEDLQEEDSDTIDRGHTVDTVSPRLLDFEHHTSQELDKISGVTESFSVSVMSDAMGSVVGESFQGHLHCHFLPNTHKACYNERSNRSSDDEDEFETSERAGEKRHTVAGTTDQVLLLDISAKPAELFVSYKPRSEEEENIPLCKNDKSGATIREQRDQARSPVDGEKSTSAGTEGLDKTRTGSWTGKTKEDIESEDQSTPSIDDLPEAEVMEEVLDPEEGESQTSCSPPRIADCLPVSILPTLPVCVPSTLSNSMPRNVSGHLSAPLLQPFQCSLCERSFSQRGSLNRHVRSHLGVRPFPCPCCPMTFSRQYRVTEHMRVHRRCTQGNDFPGSSAS